MDTKELADPAEGEACLGRSALAVDRNRERVRTTARRAATGAQPAYKSMVGLRPER